MSEAKLTDIHFLAVSVFYKHTHYTFPLLNPLSKAQWKMFTAK